MAENSMKDIKDWFGKDSKPVDGPEFRTFWTSLSEEEKEEFKNADLS